MKIFSYFIVYDYNSCILWIQHDACVQIAAEQLYFFKAIGNLLNLPDVYTKQKCLIVCRVQLLCVPHVRRKVTWRETVLTVDYLHFLQCHGQTSNISECSMTFSIQSRVCIWLLLLERSHLELLCFCCCGMCAVDSCVICMSDMLQMTLSQLIAKSMTDSVCLVNCWLLYGQHIQVCVCDMAVTSIYSRMLRPVWPDSIANSSDIVSQLFIASYSVF